jgi:lipopolysaccharide/colanic/teichoic acid biosynthesis glycosyltransferase
MKVVVGVEMTVTSSDDVRITTIGGFFRRVKIDELPQLWNVLIGQMSFVGPRPDVAGYADKLKGEDRIILSVKPGITGPAQLAYRDEEKILSNQNNHIKYNDEVIWPDKIKINRMYVENYSFFKDLYYIGKTVVGGDVKY